MVKPSSNKYKEHKMSISNKHTTTITRGVIANVLKAYNQGMSMEEITHWLRISTRQYIEIMYFHKTAK